jgi:hypothetical protein
VAKAPTASAQAAAHDKLSTARAFRNLVAFCEFFARSAAPIAAIATVRISFCGPTIDYFIHLRHLGTDGFMPSITVSTSTLAVVAVRA